MDIETDLLGISHSNRALNPQRRTDADVPGVVKMRQNRNPRCGIKPPGETRRAQ